MSAELCVEYAKSARAECRKCKLKIEKDALRVGVTSEIGGHAATKWFHAGCMFAPRKHAALRSITSCGDMDGFGSLQVADQDRLSEWLAGKNLPGSAGDEAPTIAALSPADMKSMSAQDLQQVLQVEGLSDAGSSDRKDLLRKVGDVQTEVAALKRLEARYAGMTIGAMKAELRLNEQLLSGVKIELVRRCVDGNMYSPPPARCVVAREHTR
jgi:hypothetical protein